MDVTTVQNHYKMGIVDDSPVFDATKCGAPGSGVVLEPTGGVKYNNFVKVAGSTGKMNPSMGRVLISVSRQEWKRQH